jgi:hypothetical protein
MKIIKKTSVSTAICVLLVACSEVSVMDKLGLGKSPPDESQVVTNNSLALPPDLQLPPQATAQANSVVTATPPDAFASAPATTEVASAEQSPYDTGEQQLTTDGTTTAPAQTTGTAVQATQKRDVKADPREDAFQKFGISKTRPDGTPKTRAELDRELLEAVRQEKRKQNPNYGTVFNMGELFKGN